MINSLKRCCAVLAAVLLATAAPAFAEEKTVRTESWRMENRNEVFAWIPEGLPAEPVPMVLAMNCTNGNPQAEVKTNGWDVLCAEEGFIVIAPEYRDSASYEETDYLRMVIEQAVSRYPVDPSRVYATGFSNGGAAAIALASEYPELIAGISAAGWLVEVKNTEGLLTPFQVLKGTEEFTVRNGQGDMELMEDEKNALRTLFEMNRMPSGETDYHAVPYWGYRPDRQESIWPEYKDYHYYGGSGIPQSNVEWQISDYCLEGYEAPFAQLVLIEGADHTPHDYHARIAWDFFSRFSRNTDGTITERK
ncbi:MAG: hypothetical protein IJK71_11005 [Clostridia bacterium]|nr:hypothetical protein [Clostridia bacterium]